MYKIVREKSKQELSIEQVTDDYYIFMTLHGRIYEPMPRILHSGSGGYRWKEVVKTISQQWAPSQSVITYPNLKAMLGGALERYGRHPTFLLVCTQDSDEAREWLGHQLLLSGKERIEEARQGLYTPLQ